MKKFNVENIEGTLILISCTTHDLEDKSTTYSRVLPHTIRNGKFNLFELDGENEGIDRYFPMAKYEETPLWSIDLNDYDTVEEVAQHILRTDGKKIINAFYCDEEVVVDNKLTISIYNCDREEVYSATKTFKIDRPKPSKVKDKNEGTVQDNEALFRPLDMSNKEDERIFLHDRRIVIFHLKLFAAVAITVGIIATIAGWSTKGGWIIAITSGLYLTQLWWCNMPRKSLGSRLWNDKVRHAKGRPWINGGAISGAALTCIIATVGNLSGANFGFARYYLIFLATALCITLTLRILKNATNNKSKGEEEYEESLSDNNSKRQLKRLRRSFWKEFVRRLLPWNWKK